FVPLLLEQLDQIARPVGDVYDQRTPAVRRRRFHRTILPGHLRCGTRLFVVCPTPRAESEPAGSAGTLWLGPTGRGSCRGRHAQATTVSREFIDRSSGGFAVSERRSRPATISSVRRRATNSTRLVGILASGNGTSAATRRYSWKICRASADRAE